MSLPYRVETTRSVLRCPDPADAERLLEAENRSRPELRRFMPWAEREGSLDETVAKLRLFRAAFDRAEDHIYFAFDRTTGDCIGGAGLHAKVGPGGLMIGYWVDSARHRTGLATEWAAALTRVAFEVAGARFVEIRTARENTNSQGVPKKLGYVHEATLRDRFELRGGTLSDMFLFTMLVQDYAASQARTCEASAFDAVGRKVL